VRAAGHSDDEKPHGSRTNGVEPRDLTQTFGAASAQFERMVAPRVSRVGDIRCGTYAICPTDLQSRCSPPIFTETIVIINLRFRGVQTGVQLARFWEPIAGLNGAESTIRVKINSRMLPPSIRLSNLT
jgi:hypothetical protein